AAVVLLVGSEWVALRLFDQPALVVPLRWLVLATPGVALVVVLAFGLRGLERIRDAQIVHEVATVSLALLLFVCVGRLFGPAGAAATYVLATLGACAIGCSAK
ncbi:MAG: hypothetical protein ACLFRU_08380, partial [Paracoccaceae bacterium]